MPISGKTKACVIEVLDKFKTKNKIPNLEILDLLTNLCDVSGNSSFEITMISLKEAWEDEIDFVHEKS